MKKKLLLIFLAIFYSTIMFSQETGNHSACDCILSKGQLYAAVDGCDVRLDLARLGIGSCATLIQNYTWDFGDGSTDTTSGEGLISTSHSYSGNGTYTVTLSFNLQDNTTGELCNVSYNTTVQVTDCVPHSACDCILSKGQLYAAVNGCDAILDLSGLGIGSCATLIQEYTWDFGDGSTDTTSGGGLISTTHSYSGNGTYTATVSFNLKDNATGELCNVSYETTVQVTDCVPHSACDCILSNGQLYAAVNGCDAILDLGGLGIGSCATLIQEYTWDFGDGSTDTTTGGGLISTTHSYSGNGTYTATVSFNLQDNVTGELCNVSYETTVQVTDCEPEPCLCDNIVIDKFIAKQSQKNKCLFAFETGFSVNCGAFTSITHTFDFGDGTVTTSPTGVAWHQYANSGTYTVTLTITIVDVNGCESTVQSSISITANCGTESPCNLTAPTNLHIGGIIGTTLFWDPVPGAVGYIVSSPHTAVSCHCKGQVSIVPIQTNQNILALPQSLVNKCFAWQVTAICADGSHSPTSTSICYSGENPSGKNFKEVSITPNPTRGEMTFNITTSADTKVTVKVFDTYGTLIKSFVKQVISDKASTISWDGSNLKKGIYFVNFSTKEETIHKQVIVK